MAGRTSSDVAAPSRTLPEILPKRDNCATSAPERGGELMHGRALARVASVALASIALLACGGDDAEPDATEASPTEAAASATATQEATQGATADTDGGAGGDAGDDMTAAILGDVFGLPPNFITESERNCMNAELAAAYPEGLPANYNSDEELLDAVDAAAVTCNVSLR
jgi:hypothetical protein